MLEANVLTTLLELMRLCVVTTFCSLRQFSVPQDGLMSSQNVHSAISVSGHKLHDFVSFLAAIKPTCIENDAPRLLPVLQPKTGTIFLNSAYIWGMISRKEIATVLGREFVTTYGCFLF